jgi:hypothetical protein
MTSMTDRWLPSRADLDLATARTAAAMADPAATRTSRLLAAEAEEATHLAYLQRPGAEAELQAEAEAGEGTVLAAPTDGDAYWPQDQPIPYTLTGKAEALLAAEDERPRAVRRLRTPHRSWTLTAKAEALLAAQDRPNQAP